MHPTVLYEYQPGRGGHNPAEFLKGFTGYLQSDGYNGYDQVPDVTHVECMAHMKRKFHEAVAVLPQNKKSGAAVEGEAYCTVLFKLEEEFAELSPEERQQKRNELSKENYVIVVITAAVLPDKAQILFHLILRHGSTLLRIIHKELRKLTLKRILAYNVVIDCHLKSRAHKAIRSKQSRCLTGSELILLTVLR